MSSTEYVEGIQAGNRIVLAKAITLIESSRASDRDLAQEVIESCLRSSGSSIRIGVTGVPGAGKSTLIEALGRHIIEDFGEKVAVLAVDPTSQLGGGSILGDKARMNFLAASDMAFVRPSPTRGVLGGVGRHTREAIVLCEAAGYRNVFVETVGVGQSETAVSNMVDFFLLVAIAGAGDELQAIKRGIMEMVDAVIVNKADGENICPAERARADAEAALHFLPARASGSTPSAMLCSARTGLGVAQIWSTILDYYAKISGNGFLDRGRREQRSRWFEESIEEELMQLFLSNHLVNIRKQELEQQVQNGEITGPNGARKLLSLFACGSKEKQQDES